jgi:hypothetical protein
VSKGKELPLLEGVVKKRQVQKKGTPSEGKVKDNFYPEAYNWSEKSYVANNMRYFNIPWKTLTSLNKSE